MGVMERRSSKIKKLKAFIKDQEIKKAAGKKSESDFALKMAKDKLKSLKKKQKKDEKWCKDVDQFLYREGSSPYDY
jgi:hypothetical protein